MDVDNQRVTREQFQNLVKHTDDLCISMVAKMKPSWPESQENRIRVKNLIRDARKICLSRDYDEDKVDQLLKPIEEKLDDDLFWSHQFKGLAVYLSKSVTEILRLDQEVDDNIVVGESFDLRILSNMFSLPAFRIFCFAFGSNRLLRVDGASLKEESVKDMPASINETAKYDDLESTNVTWRTAEPTTNGQRPSRAVFYGVDTDRYEDGKQRRYIHQVGKALGQHLNGTKEKLYLIADAGLGCALRDELESTQLSSQRFDRNPEGLSDQEMLRLVRSHLEESRIQDDLDRLKNFEAYSSKNMGSLDVEQILTEARKGRIEKLLIPNDQMDGHIAELIHQAASETLRKSGEVHTIHRDDWSLEDAKAAAFFRF